MAMLRLAIREREPLLHDPMRAPEQAFRSEHARRAAPRLAAGAPIAVLIHGYMFDPFRPGRADPHDYLFHFDGARGARDYWGRPASWPLGLGFCETDGQGADGLCVGFGWRSRPGSRGAGFARAYGAADDAGAALLSVVERLQNAFPGRPVDMVCHSLGARVALCAIRQAAERGRADLLGAMGRLLLLAPAEFACEARAALAARDRLGGEGPALYCVLARENDLFDSMMRRAAPLRGARPLGAGGLGLRRADWIELQIDHAALQNWLAARGFRLDPRPRRLCHWGVYNRDGAMRLYAAILRERALWSIPALRAGGVPDALEPRWARLRPKASLPGVALPQAQARDAAHAAAFAPDS